MHRYTCSHLREHLWEIVLGGDSISEGTEMGEGDSLIFLPLLFSEGLGLNLTSKFCLYWDFSTLALLTFSAR